MGYISTNVGLRPIAEICIAPERHQRYRSSIAGLEPARASALMGTGMQKIVDQPTELARWLKNTGTGGQLIAFDGYQGAGKSFLACKMKKILNIPICQIDSFLIPGQRKYSVFR